MKTILFVYHTSMIGGGSYCLLNILKALDISLFKPVVVLRKQGPLVEEIQRMGIPVYLIPTMHVVPYNVSTFTPGNIKKAIEIIYSYGKFKKLLQCVKPDIVYINTMMMYPYLRIAKQKGCKTAIHIREHWPEKEHAWQRSIAVGHINKYADQILAINTYSLSMFRESPHPKNIIYDWIDLSQRDKHYPMEEVFQENLTDKKIFLFMGGLQPIKGPEEVLKAFINEVKDPNARLLFLGVSRGLLGTGWRGRVKRILKRIGYQSFSQKILTMIDSDPRIKCVPSVYDVKSIYEQTYCILSYFKIPHANLALAESIITGTVNIAARTSESEEYSKQGDLALLYEINNYQDFARQIRELDVNYDSLKKKITSDSHYVAEMFNPRANSERLNGILSQM